MSDLEVTMTDHHHIRCGAWELEVWDGGWRWIAEPNRLMPYTLEELRQLAVVSNVAVAKVRA